MKKIFLLTCFTSALLFSGDKNTELLNAVHVNDFESAVKAIKDKADVNASTDSGATALLIACINSSKFDNTPVIKLLLEAKADPEIADKNGTFPLKAAAQSGKSAIIKLLAESGADVNRGDKVGTTPLLTAVYFGRFDAASALIASKADVNKSNKNGFTPLMAACSKNDIRIVKLLIENKADAKAADRGGITAMYLTSDKNIIELLKKTGAEK